ncbi:MAG: hypothetical protein EA427_04530 [Spirochaetaceae bacterium]|nr:MAG: hypothetical protein EA427_04530 [Spirochaetaceae bacterium]
MIAFLVLSGCAVQTRYSLEIDVLSFVPEDEHAREWTADSDEDDGYRAIFLPYSEELFRESEPIGTELQKGLEVDVPVPDDPGVEDLTVSFQIDAEVFNRSGAGSIKSVEFRLLAAPHSVENVYAHGTVMSTFDTTDIRPGESRRLAGTKTLRHGDPGFDLLATGKVRLGLDGLFFSDPDVTMEYLLSILRVRISIRPFSMLP